MSLEATDWALKQRTGDPIAKFVLILISDWADCDALVNTERLLDSVAKIAELEPIDVAKALDRLDDRGLIQPIDSNGESFYRLAMPK